MIYNFDKIEKIIFLGGSKILFGILNNMDNSINKIVFTSKRFSEEIINGKQFEKYLIDSKIKYFIVDDINKCEDLNSEVIPKKTLAFSVRASWIIKQNVIDLFNNKIINLHGAKLPQNRGGGGISWNILQGNTIGNFVFHFITTGIDDGNIIKQHEFIFPANCKLPIDYYDYLHNSMIEHSIKVIDNIINKKDFTLLSQQEEFSSYWPRLNTDLHAYVNWNWNLSEIERFINAFDKPYKGAITYLNNKKVRLSNVSSQKNDGIFPPFQKGIIYRKSNLGYFVATTEGTLFIENIYYEGGVDMHNHISLGDRLYTPVSNIDEAYKVRVFYNHSGLKLK